MPVLTPFPLLWKPIDCFYCNFNQFAVFVFSLQFALNLLENKIYSRDFAEDIYPNMDKPLSFEDIAAMETQLRSSVEQDRQYWRVNDVKCDAIHTAKTYEEFADRVAAAHLRPLEKADYKSRRNGWNQYAAKEKDND